METPLKKKTEEGKVNENTGLSCRFRGVNKRLVWRDLHDCHTLGVCVFIITDKEKIGGEEVKGVGVMKEEELKIEEIEASHTQGG